MQLGSKKLLRMTLLERTNKALYHVGMALVYLSGHPLIDLVDAGKRNLALTHRLLESYRILYLLGQPKAYDTVKKLLASMESMPASPLLESGEEALPMLGEASVKSIITEPCGNPACDRTWICLETQRTISLMGQLQAVPDLRVCEQCKWQEEVQT